MALGSATKQHRVILASGGLFVLGAFVSAVIRSSVEATAKEGGVSLSVWPAAAWFSAWFLGNWISLAGWVLASSLLLMILLAYFEEKRALPMRTLEAYYQLALMLREIVTNPDTSLADIQSVRHDLEQLRGDLINKTPKVFTQATATSFQAPSLVAVGDVKSVDGLTHAQERKTIIALIDHLLKVIHYKWQAYSSTP